MRDRCTHNLVTSSEMNAVVVTVLVGFAVSCSSPKTTKEVCNDIAAAKCSRLATCSPSMFDMRWSNSTTCTTREALLCRTITADSPALTASELEPCAASWESFACEEMLAGSTPDACYHNQFDTYACVTDEECKTGYCDRRAANCGACAEVPAPGSPCGDSGCGLSMVCADSTQLCQTPRLNGQLCSADFPCKAPLECVGASASATCASPATTLGSTCDVTRMSGPDCDESAGLACNTLTGRCEMQPVAGPQMPCGIINGLKTRCKEGANCVHPQSELTGTCIPAVADMGQCDPGTGLACLFPSRCSSSNVCTFPYCPLR